MMKRKPIQPFLILVLAVTLLGLTACAASPSSPPLADVTSVPQAVSATLPPAAGAPADSCAEGDPNPIGQSIAGEYETSYVQVMTWFCAGYSFDNILIALETSEAVDVPAETLLQMLQEKEWEEIWVEVGFSESQ
jgi:hypothetical protein